MRGRTITEVRTLTTETCFSCGPLFAVDEDWLAARRRDHETWYCRNGHGQHYLAETEEDRLRRELGRAQAQRDIATERFSREALANALMKAETKAKRRVTLSIAGLGLLDESELEDAAPARPPVMEPRRRSEREVTVEEPSPAESVNTETDELDWTAAELKALMSGSGLTMGDLSVVVGSKLTRENLRDAINRWLADNPDKSLATLAGMAAAERDGRTPVTHEQPERLPFE